MNSHLIAVEIGVECGTHERMHLNGFALDKERLKCLNTETVQRWRTVQKHGWSFDDFVEDIPNFRTFYVDDFLGAFDGIDNAIFFQPFIEDKRLIELESHALGKTALMDTEFRTDDDHGTARVIDAFTEKIHTETTLLTP